MLAEGWNVRLNFAQLIRPLINSNDMRHTWPINMAKQHRLLQCLKVIKTGPFEVF